MWTSAVFPLMIVFLGSVFAYFAQDSCACRSTRACSTVTEMVDLDEWLSHEVKDVHICAPLDEKMQSEVSGIEMSATPSIQTRSDTSDPCMSFDILWSDDERSSDGWQIEK